MIITNKRLVITFLFTCLLVHWDHSNLTHAQTVVRDREIEKRLLEETELLFEETEFANLLNEIKVRHKISINLHSSAIDAGLGPDDLVSIKMNYVPLHKALVSFLEKFECTYIVRDGFLQIMTKDETEKFTLIKSYDCRNLIKSLNQQTIQTVYFNGKSILGSSESNGQMARPLIKSEKQVQSNKDAESETNSTGHYLVIKEKLSPGQHLAHIIRKTCQTKTWQKHGGQGTIVEVNGRLLIKQKRLVHQEIEGILELLKLDLGQ